jgi:hypothetical protein
LHSIWEKQFWEFPIFLQMFFNYFRIRTNPFSPNCEIVFHFDWIFLPKTNLPEICTLYFIQNKHWMI